MATKFSIKTKDDLLAFIQQPNIKMFINEEGDEVRIYIRGEEGCDDKYLFSFSPSEIGVGVNKDYKKNGRFQELKDADECLKIHPTKQCSLCPLCRKKSKKKRKKCKKCKKVIKDIDFNLKPFMNNFGSAEQMLNWVVSALQNDHPDIKASPETNGVSIYYSKNWRENEINDFKYLFNLKEVNGEQVITVDE